MEIFITNQPDDETCGPTSLHAVYQYHNDSITLEQTIKEVRRVNSGGTIAPYLGIHALSRNYKATIYTYNLEIFDPTWLQGKNIDAKWLTSKLEKQLKFKKNKKLNEATKAFIEFIGLGGNIGYHELNADLLKKYFNKKVPILTGLSATYLYQSKREKVNTNGTIVYHDIEGEPCGHFVVLSGYDRHKRSIIVADPHRENPISHDNYYKVSSSRLINAILLGVMTYDGNLLIIEK